LMACARGRMQTSGTNLKEFEDKLHTEHTGIF
jgi:hypothetical protein